MTKEYPWRLKMKKVLVSLLALTMILAFIACGQSADASSDPHIKLIRRESPFLLRKSGDAATGQDITIGVVVNSLEHVYFNCIKAAMCDG